MTQSQNSVLCVGVAVQDLIFGFDQMPVTADKHRARSLHISGGGNAANAAVAISRMGGRALLAARLGDDFIADTIIRDLSREGVDCSCVQRYANRRSSLSAIFVDEGGERLIANYRDTDLPTDPGWLTPIAEQNEIGAILTDTRWPQGAAQAMQLARSRGLPGILDAEQPMADCEHAVAIASHVVFSLSGLMDYRPGATTSEVQAIAAQFNNWVAVTDGGNGLWWSAAGNKLSHVPAFHIDAVDTLGAGDIWHGVFSLLLAGRESESQAIILAHAAAALKCQRAGGRSGAPTREQVEQFLRSNELTRTDSAARQAGKTTESK